MRPRTPISATFITSSFIWVKKFSKKSNSQKLYRSPSSCHFFVKTCRQIEFSYRYPERWVEIWEIGIFAQRTQFWIRKIWKTFGHRIDSNSRIFDKRAHFTNFKLGNLGTGEVTLHPWENETTKIRHFWRFPMVFWFRNLKFKYNLCLVWNCLVKLWISKH